MARTATDRGWLREGGTGGLIGGVVMAMVAMTYTLVAQGDLLAPLKQMGALFFAIDPGSALSMIAGLMLHMVMSITFGIVFALLVQGRASGYLPLPIAGMIFSVVEWAFASYVVLPAIDRPLLATFAATGGIVAHLMYGAVLGLWIAWRLAPVAASSNVSRPVAR